MSLFKFFKIFSVVLALVIGLPFVLIGAGFIIAGFMTDPAQLTADGFPAQYFFYLMGAIFLGYSLIGLVTAVPLHLLFHKLEKNAEQKTLLTEQLKATGVQGKARVAELNDTGMLVNHNPRVRLTLEIRIENRSPYRIQKTEIIPLIRISQVQVGGEIDVLVDPNDPQNPDRIILVLK
jgi:hypothetical protein